MAREMGAETSDAFCCALTLLGSGTLKVALAALFFVKAGMLGSLCPLSPQPFAP